MEQYGGSPGRSTYCYAKLAASFINLLHYCLPTSGFYDAGKNNRSKCTTIRLDATPSGLSDLYQYYPPFTPNALSAATLAFYPGLGQALNIAGLHTRWL